MARKRRYRRPDKEVPEMDITTFLNLMVVLVPFLLITAVFSRVTILELNVPEGNIGQKDPTKLELTIEVIVREKGLEIGNGKIVLARFPKVDGKYDLAGLSKQLLAIKRNYPDKTNAMVLLEPDIEYAVLVHVMDAVRIVELSQSDSALFEKVSLFPDISIGDAP